MHVIDELVVNLGIDTRKFREGERDALESFNRTKQGAEQFEKSVERQSAKLTDIFGIVRKGAMGIVGAFIGGEAAAFVNHITNMDAATGRMARTIGTSVQNLSTWQYMIRQVGGEATAATSALSSLQQEIESVRQGGGSFEGGFASLMNQSGASIRDDADTVLRKIQRFVSGQVQRGKMKPEEATTYLRRVPGMNQDMINLLLGDFKRIEEAARAIGGATKETTDAAASLQGKFSLFTQAIENFGRILVRLTDFLTGGGKTSDVEKMKGVFPEADFNTSIIGRIRRLLGGESDMESAKRRLAEGLGSGGSRGDRNNNPGNIEDGPFARRHGATGSDGRFAIFPDAKTGSDAQIALVQSGAYRGLTLDQFGNKYSEGAPAWKKTVGGALGIGGGDIVDNQDPRLIEAIRRAEGTGARGSAGSRVTNSRSSSVTSSTDVHIGKIEVVAPAANDADSVSREIGGAMQRQKLLAPSLTGLN